MSLIRKDKSAEANSLGFQADINEKVLRLYNRVEGTYEGMVLVPGATLNPIHARVTLTATLNEKGKPVLKAFYERIRYLPNHGLQVCPVDCIPFNPEHPESKEDLMEKFLRLTAD